MPTFTYIARSSDGTRVDGSLEAADRSSAMQRLQQMGHSPLSVTPASKKSLSGTTPLKLRFRFKLSTGHTQRMKPRAMLLFSREISDLLASGMTLGRALNTLARRDSDPASAGIIKRLRDEVVQGNSLSDALRIYPETFPKLYISMVRAGETSGALGEALRGLCTHYERVQEAKNKVVTAMIYPAFVLGIGFFSVVGLMIFIVPTFSTIFDDLGGSMPLATRILIEVSNGMIRYGWLMLLVLIGGGIAFHRFVKTERGTLWRDEKLLKLPVVSKITRANAFAHFARTLETLLRNGVPVLKALSISEETVGNSVIASEIASTRNRVTDGSSIAGPLAAGGVFPPLLTDMLSVGEETGDLPSALSQIVKRYEEELDFSIKVLTTVLEPVMMLGMALIIGFVAISMLMAVFDLTTGLGV